MRQPTPDMAIHPLGIGPPCRRLMITAPGAVEVVETHLPRLGAHDVHVRTVLSGISHGTEIAWLKGDAAALHRDWDARLRFYRDGAGRDFPVAPGYETVGRVAGIGAAVSAVSVGDLVAIDVPHADAHLVDEATAAAGLLPPDIDPSGPCSSPWHA